MCVHLGLVLKETVCYISKQGSLRMSKNSFLNVSRVCPYHSIRQVSYFVFKVVYHSGDVICKITNLVMVTQCDFKSLVFYRSTVFPSLPTFSNGGRNWRFD